MNLQKYFAFYEPKKLNLLLSLFLLLKELPVRWSRCFTLFNPPLNFFSWQINLSVRLSNLTSLYLGWKYFSAFRSILQHFVCRIKLRNFDAVYFLEKNRNSIRIQFRNLAGNSKRIFSLLFASSLLAVGGTPGPWACWAGVAGRGVPAT